MSKPRIYHMSKDDRLPVRLVEMQRADPHKYANMHRATFVEQQKHREKIVQENEKRFSIQLSAKEIALMIEMINYRLQMTDMYWTAKIELEALVSQLRREREKYA